MATADESPLMARLKARAAVAEEQSRFGDHNDFLNAVDRIERLETALRPFADFADKAEEFVDARAKDGGSPIMPTKNFRLADFQRAKSALATK